MSCTCRTTLTTLSKRSIHRSTLSTRQRTLFTSRSTFASSTPSPTPTPSETTPPPSTSSSTPSPSLSSCPEGTVLKGLNYLKDESPVLSKPDSEYPKWLWNLATSSESEVKKGGAKSGKKGKSVDEAEVLRVKKKELKMEGRKGIKASNALKG